ncbi:hypothetical protein FOZ61_000292 [Perkinsus olseni]|uniref:Uncharacterized protein n=1 Tax=Perkinsus olseni TaxID=32597 RepID=A0A7J6KV68_PEROL|nr:hypothetical protein FOZ61_000292 [Perkinsus olseni]
MPKPVSHEDLDLLRSELIGMIDTVKKGDMVTAVRPIKMDIEKLKASVETELPQQIKKASSDLRSAVERKLSEGLSSQQKSQANKFAELQETLDRTRTELDALAKRLDDSQSGHSRTFAALDKRLERMQSENLEEVGRVSREAMTTLRKEIEVAITDARARSKELQQRVDESASKLEAEVKAGNERITHKGENLEKTLVTRMTAVENLVDEAVTVAHNVSTRRIEWKLQEVSRVLGEPRHAQVFSPPISAGGAGIMRLEVRVRRLKNLEGSSDADDDSTSARQQPSDCSVFLWAPAGTTVVFELHVGDKWGPNGEEEAGENTARRYRSMRYEHTFVASLSAFGGMDFHLKQFSDWIEDSLIVGVEVLEIQATLPLMSTLKSPQELAEEINNGSDDPLPLVSSGFPIDLPLPSFESTPCGEFPQSLSIMRYTSHRTLDQVRRYVDQMKNRSCKRVEWRIDNISVLARTFTQGRPLHSCPFTVAGLEQVRLIFYPAGYFNAASGYCSLYTRAPPGTAIRAKLFIGRQPRNVAFEFDGSCSAFGRANFCLLQSEVDQATDSVTVGVEIIEGKQVLMARLPGSNPSTIKMVRSEGGGALEGVREVNTDVMAMPSENSQMLSTSSLSDYLNNTSGGPSMETTSHSLPRLDEHHGGRRSKVLNILEFKAPVYVLVAWSPSDTNGPYRPTWEPLFDLFGSFDPDPAVQRMIDREMERAHFQGKDWAYRRLTKAEKVGYIRNPPPMPWCIYKVPGPSSGQDYQKYLDECFLPESIGADWGAVRKDVDKEIRQDILRLRSPEETGHLGRFGVDINMRAKPRHGQLFFRGEPRNTKRNVVGQMVECNKYIIDFSRPIATRSLIPPTAPAVRSALQDIIDFSVEYASRAGLDPDNALSFRILVKVAQQPWHVDDDMVKEAVRVVLEWLGTRHLARFWDYITVDATRVRAHAQLPHFERQGLGGAVCVSPHQLEENQGSPFYYDSRHSRSVRVPLECPPFQLWERFPNTAYGCGEKTGTARQVWVTFGYRLRDRPTRTEATRLQEELSWAKPGLCFTAET